MTWRALSLVGLSLLGAAAFAAPDCLVVQLHVPVTDEGDPNLLLAPFVAEELDKDGRVRPVVWSLTDPVFRDWTSRDVFGPFLQHPDSKIALDTARRLGVQYVLLVQGFRKGDETYPSADLYVNGRSVWRFGPRNPNKATDIVIQADGKYDEKATRALQGMLPRLLQQGGTFTVSTNGGPDFIETARSMAHNWSVLLAEGPLKSLSPRLQTDDASAKAVDPGPSDLSGPAGAGDDDVVDQAKNLVKNSQTQRALLLLRAACDLRPFDMAVRRQLVETLLMAGLPSDAASAAQAAANLKPSDPGLWVLASKAWVAASDPDKSTEALNEALARGAEGPDVDEVEGDLALLKGDAVRAMEKYDRLDPGRVPLRRAIAVALTGDAEGCANALRALESRALTIDEYALVVLFVERAGDTLADSVRSILPEIRLHPESETTIRSAEQSNNVARAVARLVDSVVPPDSNKDSHEARKLAHILLAQATLEALQFAKTNDPDLGEEAAATLGQALKLFPAVREKYGLERKYGGA